MTSRPARAPLPSRRFPRRIPSHAGAALAIVVVIALFLHGPGVARAQSPVIPTASPGDASQAREATHEEVGSGWPDWPDFGKDLIGGLTDAAGDLFTNGLTAVLEGIAEGAHRLVDGVLGSSANFVAQTPAAVSYDSPTVRGLWGIARGVANAALVLVALWSGFNLMAREHLGGQYHSAREVLPRIAIAALLVNTSLWWTRLAIDLNNALCLAFGQASLPAWETSSAGVQALFNAVLALIYLITAIFLLLQMLMRLALVDLLLVLAPLALVCWVLPQTEGWCRQWTSTFASTVYAQVAQVAALKLGGLLLAELTPLSRDQSLVSFFVATALLVLTLKIPGLMRGRLGDGLSFARYLAFQRLAGVLPGGRGK